MSTPRILVIGAHPDDCDIKAGGTATLWKQAGLDVRFVSMTNGSAGHHRLSGPELAARRKSEAAAAGAVLGIEYDVLDHDDGQLEVTLDNRLEIVRLIRRCTPDLVLTHRPNDYHPDHRYTSQLVQDAAYMVTVPPVAADTSFLERNPVFGYLGDHFTKPYPLSPDVVVDVGPVWDRVVDMLDCHESQVYEWLPFNRIVTGEVPDDATERKAFLSRWLAERIGPVADRHRDALVATYGEERGNAVRFAEAFEISEYGSPLTDEKRAELFPFVGAAE